MKIKVSELFYSIQGEGMYMGVPSVFLRTFGCNFTCAGFGMPRGQLSQEREAVNAAEYDSYNSLPLVKTGCDSYASWDPRFKDLSPFLEISEIAERIKNLLPDGRFNNDKHLIITGGEPLLGWQRAYPLLLEEFKSRGMNLPPLTFETNGTQKLQEYLKQELRYHYNGEGITFSVSPKLPCSGEAFEDAIKPSIVAEYQRSGEVYLKFVVATEQDVEDAERAVELYREGGFIGSVYLMPVGGVESVYELNAKRVALMALERGWRYSDRLQVPLFKNEWGT